MTSKNSFWVDIRENNKRRLWLWVITWLFFLLYNGLGITLAISNEKSWLYSTPIALTEMEKKRRLIEAAEGFFENSFGVFLVAAIILSVLAAMQGFSYLNKRRQIDFYHSLPVKKSRRFFVIWLNGIFIYLLPSLVTTILALVIAAVQGLLTVPFLGELVFIYFLIFALFLAIYHVNLIALMLTGNVVIGFFVMIILQGYEMLMHGMRSLFMQEFFAKYSTMGYQMKAYLTPYFWLAVMGDSQISAVSGHLVILFLAIQAAVFLGIAFFLYCKRPAEAAGRAMAFTVTQPVVKIGVTVPLALLVALGFRAGTSYGYYEEGNPFFITLGIIITVVIVCCLMEVIYDFDIRAALKQKRHILISGSLAALIFLIFRFDIFGYDKYVPAPEKVNSYAVILPYNDADYFWEDGSYARKENYIVQNMFATDAENICALALNQPDRNIHSAINVLYRLNSGRTVSRYIWLDFDDPETLARLNHIFSSEAYKKGAFMVMADYFDALLVDGQPGYQTEALYMLGAYIYRVPDYDLKRLAEAYREDLRAANYVDFYGSLPYGEVSINIMWDSQHHEAYDPYRYSWRYGANLEITEKSFRTLSVLNGLGIDTATPLRTEDVDYITVRYYDYDSFWNYAHQEVTYDETDEIEAIVPHLWISPRYNNQYVGKNLYEDNYDTDGRNYEVMVFLKEEDRLIYGSGRYNYGYFRFLAGQVPSFVQADLGVR